MKINYDKLADALYLSLSRGKVSKTVKMKDRLLVDVDKEGKILGIEVLAASTQMAKNKIGQLEIGLPLAV